MSWTGALGADESKHLVEYVPRCMPALKTSTMISPTNKTKEEFVNSE